MKILLSPPSIPYVPSAPSAPSAPSPPSVLSVLSVPSVPSVPSLRSPRSRPFLRPLLTATLLLPLLPLLLATTTTARAADPIVSEAELKIITELVQIEKDRQAAGLVTLTDVLAAERLQLRAEYWAGKITRPEFLEKANALHTKIIDLLKSKIATDGTSKTILLKAYQDLFEDRRLP